MVVFRYNINGISMPQYDVADLKRWNSGGINPDFVTYWKFETLGM